MQPIVEMRNINKIYKNGVYANRDIDFSVQKGEIHALVGENGAGKSTLMKILYGLEKQTSGDIVINGKQHSFHSPNDAISAGIGMVHQNFMLIPSFTVAQNIVLSREPMKNGLIIDELQSNKIVRELSEKYNLHIDSTLRVSDINVADKQRTEILKALYRDPEVLIFDEPTAVLSPQETVGLFDALSALVDAGKTVIFITHKLKEVKAVSNRITVMREGEKVTTVNTNDVSESDISEMMVGRKVLFNLDKEKAVVKETVIETKNLCATDNSAKKVLDNISFSIKAGEILGVAGVEGNGQRELVEIITGIRQKQEGEIFIHEEALTEHITPAQVRKMGVAHIPEDRLYNGVAFGASIKDNLIIDRLRTKAFSKKSVLNLEKIDSNSKESIDHFNIVAKDGETSIESLSGGNMQKVIIAREFTSGSKLLIVSQPTRGVDIGASEYIRKKLLEQSRMGCAVLLISADLAEVISLSDRIVTLHDGKITGEFDNTTPVDEKELGLYMLGIKNMFESEK